jgi:hypothetical protein
MGDQDIRKILDMIMGSSSEYVKGFEPFLKKKYLDLTEHLPFLTSAYVTTGICMLLQHYIIIYGKMGPEYARKGLPLMMEQMVGAFNAYAQSEGIPQRFDIQMQVVDHDE